MSKQIWRVTGDVLFFVGIMIGVYWGLSLGADQSVQVPFVQNKTFANTMPSGQVWPVRHWMNECLNDPEAVQFVRWGRVQREPDKGKHIRSCAVVFRAKNGFGAYQRQHWIFYAEYHESVAWVTDIDGAPIQGFETWALKSH